MADETRKERQRRELVEEILKEARTLLEQGGPKAVSLRAIGRCVGMSAPSLYTYFPSLSDLFTELISQSYHSLAEHITAAIDPTGDASLRARLANGPAAYRDWALTNRQQFNLIFFDQIADYEAPADGPTVVAQIAVLRPIAADYAAVRGTTLEHLAEPGDMLDDFLGWWATFHGLVALEVNHHLDWVNPRAVFDRRVQREITQLFAATNSANR